MTDPLVEPELDPGALERLTEITGGDLDFVHELIETYLQDGAEQIALMRAALDPADVTVLGRAAHSLRSGSVSVGAIPLSERCRTLEEAARAGPVPDAADQVAAIGATWDRVQLGLRSTLASASGGQAARA